MGSQVRGTVEGTVLVLAWLALYTTVVGPAVGAVVPGFEEPMRLWATGCTGGCPAFPSTARGWLGIASTTLVVGAYVAGSVWLRRRGDGPAD